jgi:hypothetical protein
MFILCRNEIVTLFRNIKKNVFLVPSISRYSKCFSVNFNLLFFSRYFRNAEKQFRHLQTFNVKREENIFIHGYLFNKRMNIDFRFAPKTIFQLNKYLHGTFVDATKFRNWNLFSLPVDLNEDISASLTDAPRRYFLFRPRLRPMTTKILTISWTIRGATVRVTLDFGPRATKTNWRFEISSPRWGCVTKTSF